MGKISLIVYNSLNPYFVIDSDKQKEPKRMLLQRIYDGEIVIVSGVVFESNLKCYWQHGRYFGRNLKAAVDAWEVKNDK